MSQDWNSPDNSWQSTDLPWKDVNMPWNSTDLPWKAGGGADTVDNLLANDVSSTSSVSAPTLAEAASTLLTDLVSWWPMQEASGTREDVHGTWDLTVNSGSVGQTTGHVEANAADVATVNQVLIGDQSGFDFSASWTIAGWVKPTSLAGTLALFGKPGEFRCLVDTAGKVYMQSPGAFSDSAETLNGAITEGDWHLFIATYNPAGNVTIQIGHDTTLGSVFTNTVDAAISDGTDPLWVAQSAISDFTMVGATEQWAVWSRVITTDEVTELFNGGAGVTYGSL
jgi:hypothetical protein